MNKKQSLNNGYIMIFALLVIAALMVIVSYVGYRGSMHGPFMQMVMGREKAKLLAMSGVNIAMSQLSFAGQDNQNAVSLTQGETAQATAGKENVSADRQKKSSSADKNKEFLQRILPTLNIWQTFNLKEEVDGVDGLIQICLMSEEGKIDLNYLYDFKKKKFMGQQDKGMQAIMQELCQKIESSIKIPELFSVFEKSFKERHNEYNDPTELCAKKEFGPFKKSLFYEPVVTSKDAKNKQQPSIYLTDIFTVWSSSGTIDPWLFSHSLMILFGLSTDRETDPKKAQELIAQSLKNFKQTANWKQDWKTIMQPLYQQELQALPKNIDSLLSSTFDPHYFSVRVHATVNGVTQMLYAILERECHQQDDTNECDVTLKKLYWI
jgi:hypothetical protein